MLDWSSLLAMTSSVSRAEDGRRKEQGPIRHRRGPVDLFSSERSAQTRTQSPREEGLSRAHEPVNGLRLAHGGTLTACSTAVNETPGDADGKTAAIIAGPITPNEDHAS